MTTTIDTRTLEAAAKLAAMSPEEILFRIQAMRANRINEAVIDIFATAYRANSELRLLEALGK